MPAYAAALVDLVDKRVDQAQLKPTKMGTVQGRATDTAVCMVAFDGGSGIAQTVKCFESVVVDVGDRVGLIKFEGEWVAIANYTPRTWGDELISVQLSSLTTVPGTLFVDMPTSPTVVITKARDITQFQITLGCSLRAATAQPMTFEVGVLIGFPDGTSSDQALYHRAINVADAHFDYYGGLTTTGLTAPGGGYTFTGRWRRISGTGTLTMDSNDSITIHVKEVTV